MRSGTKKRMELEERMRKVLFSTMIPMACLMIILLFIFWQYTGQYNKLSENLAVSSEFNLRFKDDLDLEMYYIAIGRMFLSRWKMRRRSCRNCEGILIIIMGLNP